MAIAQTQTELKRVDEVEEIVKDFDDIWKLTEDLVSNGAIINKNDFRDAWREKLRTTLTQHNQTIMNELVESLTWHRNTDGVTELEDNVAYIKVSDLQNIIKNLTRE